MRIYVVEQDGAGGLIHYAYQMCGALSRAGAEVTLVTGQHYELADLPHTFTVEPRIRLWKAVGAAPPRSRLTSVLARIGRKLRRAERAVRYAIEWHRLTRYLIDERPDIVQLSIIRFPFQVVFLRRMRRAGLTLTQICHEFEERDRGSRARFLKHHGNTAVFRTFDHIYLHGEANRDRFHRLFDIPLERTSSIRHGDEAMFVGPDRGTAPLPAVPTALFFGGLRPSKGIEDLIDAWEQVRYELNARLRICGEPAGVDPIALREQTESVGVAVSVDIDPTYQPMERVPDLMEGATVVVLPYRTAAASGVLQLAYAFGRPVVATRTGALAEDVVDGETGFLVAPGDIDGLARALIKLLGDPEAARDMGAAARRASLRFGWNPIASAILDDYRELGS